MYYEAIPLDMALRAFGGETQVRRLLPVGHLPANIDPQDSTRAVNPMQTARTSTATASARAPARTPSTSPTAATGFGQHLGGLLAGRSRPQGLLHPAVRRRHPVRGPPGPHPRRRLHRPPRSAPSSRTCPPTTAPTTTSPTPPVSKPWTATAGPYDGHHLQPDRTRVGTRATRPATSTRSTWPKPDARLRRLLGHPEQALLQEVAGPGELHLVVAAAATTPASSARRTPSSTRTSPPSTTSCRCSATRAVRSAATARTRSRSPAPTPPRCRPTSPSSPA